MHPLRKFEAIRKNRKSGKIVKIEEIITLTPSTEEILMLKRFEQSELSLKISKMCLQTFRGKLNKIGGPCQKIWKLAITPSNFLSISFEELDGVYRAGNTDCAKSFFTEQNLTNPIETRVLQRKGQELFSN